MNKQNRILAAALAVQIVILVIVFWPETSVARGERLFGDLQADQIVAITISDAQGQRIQMEKSPEGWVLPDADAFPVEEDNVLALLDKIVDLRTDRLVTQTRDSHRRLQVADDELQRLIEFELQDGTRRKLFLGSSPRYQVLHVRADDQDQVYLALGMTVSDAGAGIANWINTTYFSASVDQIRKLTLENKNGRFEFEKDEAGNWTMINLPPGETLLENNVTSLVTRISSLRMVRPLGREQDPSYGLDDPNAVVTVVTRDEEDNEKTFIVRVGAALEGETGEGYVVKSATSSYYVLMADFTVNDLIERTLQDFIEVLPTPTPEAVPEATPAA
jgi:hypothetical protein